MPGSLVDAVTEILEEEDRRYRYALTTAWRRDNPGYGRDYYREHRDAWEKYEANRRKRIAAEREALSPEAQKVADARAEANRQKSAAAAERARAWRLANPERHKELVAQWKEKNHERDLAHKRKYREKNRESLNRKKRESRARAKEEALMNEWDGNGWAPDGTRSCECDRVYPRVSGVCPSCGGSVPTMERLPND